MSSSVLLAINCLLGQVSVGSGSELIEESNLAALDPSEILATSGSSEIWTMVIQSGPMVKFVIICLVLFSIISWAIIFTKWLQIGRAERNSFTFLNAFWKSRSLGQLYTDSAEMGYSPLAQIFRAGYQEFGRSHKVKLNQATIINNVQRALRRAATIESGLMNKHLSFLASCGNAAPFIGLFGTVWGIMNSFHQIGAQGSANLATVAPGISEALIATAVGLAAAIPAVMFFNHFNGKIESLETEMASFMSDFTNILERDSSQRSNN